MTIYVQLCTCIHCFSSCMSSRHIKTIQIETLDHSEALHFPLTWPYSSFCERPSTPGLPTVFIYRCSRISIDFSTGHCIIRIISQWANEFCTSKTPAAALFSKQVLRFTFRSFVKDRCLIGSGHTGLTYMGFGGLLASSEFSTVASKPTCANSLSCPNCPKNVVVQVATRQTCNCRNFI